MSVYVNWLISQLPLTCNVNCSTLAVGSQLPGRGGRRAESRRRRAIRTVQRERERGGMEGQRGRGREGGGEREGERGRGREGGGEREKRRKGESTLS